MPLFTAYKPLGVSPLYLIEELKKKDVWKKEKIAYAGRLDPMAEGLVLLVYGKDLSSFHEHLKYDKEYEGSILFGLSTDSYDLLGIPQKRQVEESIKEKLKSIKGEFVFPFPPYSSYRVKGKPLFKWSREGKIGEIEIPLKEAHIYSIELGDVYYRSALELKEEILWKIEKVKGDFRQEEIKEKWKEILVCGDFPLIDFKIKCSSGCYMRSVAHHAGGVLFHLKRTSIDF